MRPNIPGSDKLSIATFLLSTCLTVWLSGQHLKTGMFFLLVGAVSSVWYLSHKEAPRESNSALHQLPPPPANFVGRENEVRELVTGLKREQVRCLLITGLGGVGKTGLALKLAEQLTSRYKDAQFYVDLKGWTSSAPALSPKLTMEYVVHCFDRTGKLPESDAELSALYRSLLRNKRALLVLDNARGRDQVEELIPPGGCLTMITSREHFDLDGLAAKRLDQLSPEKARDLLRSTAPRLANEKSESVSKLVDACGGLPQALKLVARALNVHTDLDAADYVRRLSDEKERLKLTETDVAMQVSYDLLSPELQKALCALAVFPGSFDPRAAAAIWECTDTAAKTVLSDLLAYSLVEFNAESKRYRLHDLVHDFADSKLGAYERAAFERRHAGHYRSVLAEAEGLYLKGDGSQLHGLALYDVESANINAGQRWAEAHAQDDEDSARLCSEYAVVGAECLEVRLDSSELIRWSESGLAAARRLGEPTAAHVGNLGTAYLALGDYRRGVELFEQSLQMAREFSDRPGEGKALRGLGNAYLYLGQFKPAISAYEQSLEIFAAAADRTGEGKAFGNLGIAFSALGEHRRAIEFFEQHLKIARERGDRRGEASALGGLGNAYLALGEQGRPKEFFEQRLKIAHEIGDQRGEGNALGNLGLACHAAKEYRRAIEFFERSLQIEREVGDRLREGLTLGNLGNVYASMGECRRGVDLQEQYLKIARQIGDPRGEGAALWNWSCICQQMGEHAQAVLCAEESLAIFEKIEDPRAEKVRSQLTEWRGR